MVGIWWAQWSIREPSVRKRICLYYKPYQMAEGSRFFASTITTIDLLVSYFRQFLFCRFAFSFIASVFSAMNEPYFRIQSSCLERASSKSSIWQTFGYDITH